MWWQMALTVVVAAAGGASSAPAADDLEVWVVPSTERVLRSDTPGGTTAGVLYAARNEWESFQIAVRSTAPVRVTGLEMSTLSHPAIAMLPPKADESWRFYREHQVHIAAGTYRNRAFKPGWYSDALIPLERTSPSQGEVAPQVRVRVETGKAGGGRDPHPNPLPGRERETKQPRFVALPFDLPADETHAFWVDVYIPETMGSGEHRRWVWVRAADGAFRSIPVTLHVWGFALPRLATLKTQFGSPAGRIRAWYQNEVKAGREKAVPDDDLLHSQAAQLLSEHRFDAAIPPKLLSHKVKPDGSFDLTAEQIAGLKEFAQRYHVNAVPVRPPSSQFADPVKDRDRIVNWLKSWDRNLEAAGLGDRLCYTYLLDEPNDAKAYEHTRQWGRLVREAGSRVKVLVTEQPQTENPAWGTLEGAVDIWVPLFCLLKADPAAKRQALGEEVWAYTALCQGKEPTPWWHTDWPLAHYRVPAWIAWRYRMKGLLYWGGMAYWEQTADPWTDPWTYGKTKTASGYEPKGSVYNGEGTLLYPGRDVGLAGAVPSVRLKVLRDAIEDFEYLAILDRLGKREEALAIVSQVARSWTDWTNDSAAISAARQALGQLIVQATAPRP